MWYKDEETIERIAGADIGIVLGAGNDDIEDSAFFTFYAKWEKGFSVGGADDSDTGDDSNMLPWITLATATLLASLGLVLTARRKKA